MLPVYLVFFVLVSTTIQKSSLEGVITPIGLGGSGLADEPTTILSQIFTSNKSQQGNYQFARFTQDASVSEIPYFPTTENVPDVKLFPIFASPIAILYRIDDILTGTLTLNRTTLVKIFRAEITSWNDPEIVSQNPTLTLPNRRITRVVRTDGSGTNYALTKAFSAFDPDWSTLYGATYNVNWPSLNTTIPASTNIMMRSRVVSTPYSIGYGSISSDVSYANIINKAGKKITPSSSSVASAMLGFDYTEFSNSSNITDTIHPSGYPICTFSYVNYRSNNMSSCDKALEFYYFISYVLSSGGSMLASKQFAPLTDDLQEYVKNQHLSLLYCGDVLVSSLVVDTTKLVRDVAISVGTVMGIVGATILSIVIGYFLYQNHKLKKQVLHVEEGPSGFVTLFFSDVQNSTSTWNECGEDMEIAISLHNEVVRHAIAKYSGYEVKTEGDSFFVSFKDPVSALMCANEIHISLMYQEWPESILNVNTSKEIRDIATDELIFRGLRIRIGLHIGVPNAKIDPTTKRTDYFGNPVNLAARCSDSCPGGVTFITKDMYDFLDEYIGDEELEYPFIKSMGKFDLQGIAKPQELFLVLPSCIFERHNKTISNAKNKNKEGLLPPPQLDVQFVSTTSN
ncbi:adenylate cyclase [Acrasis kona]|uniref:Adenylate cyclase n=1 Tax=Acrasis kona TaxID=1008807 RepID=A0AAW2ZMZ8_9EUKA